MTPDNELPNPAVFFDAVTSYQKTEALRAAVELDIFTAIAGGLCSAAAIGSHCQAAERGVRILCDYLTVAGFLTKEGPLYGLTPVASAFLSRRSHLYLGGTLEFLLSPLIRGNFATLTDAVRKGGSTMSASDVLAPDADVWVRFARSMAPITALSAPAMVDAAGFAPGTPCDVLDIAASHGAFGISFALHNPAAKVVAVDWSNVLQAGQENAGKYGVAARWRALPGDAFTVDLGGPYDVALITNFLHHFDVPTCETFLRRIHRVLKPGGRALTLEFIPNDDRVSPPGPAAFALGMLAGTPGGDAYTFQELETMARNAGFQRSELVPLAVGIQSLIVSHA